MHEVTS